MILAETRLNSMETCCDDAVFLWIAEHGKRQFLKRNTTPSRTHPVEINKPAAWRQDMTLTAPRTDRYPRPQLFSAYI